MIIKHLFIGGPTFMSVIYILWIATIVIAGVITSGITNKKTEPRKLLRLNELILFFGSFAFLFGLFGQTVGLYHAMNAIEKAEDISPAIIAGGFKVSMLAPLYGFGLLLISGILWMIFRNQIRKKA